MVSLYNASFFKSNRDIMSEDTYTKSIKINYGLSEIDIQEAIYQTRKL